MTNKVLVCNNNIGIQMGVDGGSEIKVARIENW